jgi:hypothetical protein
MAGATVKSPTSILITAVAIAVGLLTLLGYFIPPLNAIRTTLVGWAVILAAIAVFVGVINLLSVHVQKINLSQSGYGYSLVLLVSFLLTLIVGIYSFLFPANNLLFQVISAVQFPVEASLMAVLTVSLGLAAIRLLRRRNTFFSVVFFLSVLLFLALGSGLVGWLGTNVLPSSAGLVQNLVGFLDRLPVAGARGILLGVALGSLATGLRILIGTDRPYGS